MKTSTKIVIAVLITIVVSIIVALIAIRMKAKKAVKENKVKLAGKVYELGAALPESAQPKGVFNSLFGARSKSWTVSKDLQCPPGAMQRVNADGTKTCVLAS